MKVEDRFPERLVTGRSLPDDLTFFSGGMHVPTAVDNPSLVLDELDAALDGALAVPLSCLTREEADAWAQRVQGIRNRVDALFAESAVSAHEAGVQVGSGLRTMANHVAAETGVDPAVVGADKNLGVWLRSFPGLGEASAGGLLSRRHLQVIRANDNARTHQAMIDAQEFLVEIAAEPWRDFLEALRYWVLAADPDGDEPEQQRESRKLTVRRTGDGSVSGSFRLDPVAGAALLTALNQEGDRLWRDDQESGAERTTTQRFADGLVNLVGRGAKRSNGSVPAPLIHLVMSPAVAADVLIRLACEEAGEPLPAGIDPWRLPIAHGDIDARCELVDGTPIHPRLAAAYIGIAELRRLVMSAEGEVLDLGQKVRCFPRQLKEAILVAARGRCAETGCDAPLSWLQADHELPYSRHGPTAIRNGKARCDPHNKVKGDRAPP